jgi:excisionase family DNA binding protein
MKKSKIFHADCIAENKTIQPMHQRNPKETGTLTYEVSEIAEMLSISKRTAYDFCKKTTDFKVVRVGRCVRVHKESFDTWLACDMAVNSN